MTLSVEIRDVEGTSTGSVTLDESVFGIEPNVPVLHQVVTAQLAAARSGTQSTKTRAEVSGGGKKPFKQKGTGRARQGSERAPHFKGGGVALGPKPRSYRQRTPRKMIQLALRSALSDRAADGRVAVVRDWPWETPSTKEARGALETLGLEGKVLVVLDRSQAEAYKSFRNLSGIQLILQGELNAYDILCNDWIVFTPDTLPGESVLVDSPTGVAARDGTSAAIDADADEADDDTLSVRDDVDQTEGAAAADEGAEAAAEDEPEGSVADDATAVDDDEEETGDE